MRVRLYPLGDRGNGPVVLVDRFPAVLSQDQHGDLCIDDAEAKPLCLLDDAKGNLIIKDRVADRSVMVNGLPIAHGGLMPGDTLQLGQNSYRLSYERMATVLPPCPTFHIAERKVHS